jgi:hypothetical protein
MSDEELTIFLVLILGVISCFTLQSLLFFLARTIKIFILTGAKKRRLTSGFTLIFI